jgi:hypothetical protein
MHLAPHRNRRKHRPRLRPLRSRLRIPGTRLRQPHGTRRRTRQARTTRRARSALRRRQNHLRLRRRKLVRTGGSSLNGVLGPSPWWTFECWIMSSSPAATPPASSNGDSYDRAAVPARPSSVDTPGTRYKDASARLASIRTTPYRLCRQAGLD